MFVPLNINLGNVPKLPNGRHVLAGNVHIYVHNGKKHRDNGPAEIRPDGYKAWFRDGVKHRKGGPAVSYPDGTIEYWENGKLLRRINGTSPGATGA
jgi:hypothetical protein